MYEGIGLGVEMNILSLVQEFYITTIGNTNASLNAQAVLFRF